MIEEKIENNYTGTRKIRSNVIKHVDGVIMSDKLFWFTTTRTNKCLFR